MWPGRLITSWALDVVGEGRNGLEVRLVTRLSPAVDNVEANVKESVETTTLCGIARRNELL
jgi:hypothetical protein